MASNKNRPALYELIKKSTIKPPKGWLKTPDWFYKVGERGKIIPGQSQPASEKAEKTGVNFPPIPKSPAIKTEATGGIKNGENRLFQLQHIPGTSRSNARLVVSASYWILALVGLGLVLAFLVSYRLGQKKVVSVEQYKDAPPASAIAELRNSPPRPEVMVRPSPPPQEKPVNKTEDISAVSAKPQTAAINAGAAVKNGQVLIICSLDKAELLQPVQEYFNSNGVSTQIGQFGGSFVLYAVDMVESIKDIKAEQLKKNVALIGGQYNNQKPKDAPYFNVSTFQSAYWVGIDRIK